MDNEVVKYISKYVEVTKELEKALIESTFIKKFPKGTILLKEGDISNECYLIFNGFIRSYYKRDGEEVTTDFFTEEQVVSPSCYGQNIPSTIYLECMEDTITTVGTPELEKDMYIKYPQLESLGRVMGEIILNKYKDTLDMFKMSNPEERYLALLEHRPEIIQRAPLYQIASYLGIKPESLSRIRKRIIKNK